MKLLVDKAKVLMEALPYMQRLMGKTIVIKYGGHAMTDSARIDDTLQRNPALATAFTALSAPTTAAAAEHRATDKQSGSRGRIPSKERFHVYAHAEPTPDCAAGWAQVADAGWVGLSPPSQNFGVA